VFLSDGAAGTDGPDYTSDGQSPTTLVAIVASSEAAVNLAESRDLPLAISKLGAREATFVPRDKSRPAVAIQPNLRAIGTSRASASHVALEG